MSERRQLYRVTMPVVIHGRRWNHGQIISLTLDEAAKYSRALIALEHQTKR